MAKPVVLRFIGDTHSLKRAFAELQGAAAAASAGFTKLHSNLNKWAGSTAAVAASWQRNITRPITIAAGAAAFLGTKYEATMQKIVGLVGVSQTQVSEWSVSLLEMAKTLPMGPIALAEALYYVTSSGIKTKDALKVLAATARGSAAGLGETKVVADAVTSAINAYGIKNLSAAKATDILVAAVRDGKGEPVEYATAIGRVIAPAEHLKVSFDQVAGALASMTLVGLDADESATALRQILMSMVNPTKEQGAALKEMGLNLKDVRDVVAKKGLLAGLRMLAQGAKGNDEAISALFGNVRALNGVLILTGKNVNNTKRVMHDMAHATGSTDRALAAASQTADFKFRKSLAGLQVAGIKASAAILPSLVKIADRVAALADRFSRLDPRVQEMIVHFVIFVAAVGPALKVLSALMRVAEGLLRAASGVAFVAVRLFRGFMLVAKAARIVAFWIRVLGLYFRATVLANPIGIAITAIVLLGIALVIAYKKSATFRRIVHTALHAVGTAAKAAGRAFMAAMRWIIDAFGSVASFVSTWAGRIASVVRTAFNIIAKILAVAGKVVFYAIVIPLAIVLGIIITLWNAISGAVGEAVSGILTFIVYAFTAIYGAVRSAVVGVYQSIQQYCRLWLAVVRSVLSALLAVWRVVWGAISAVARAVWAVIRAVVSAGINAVVAVLRGPMQTAGRIVGAGWNAIKAVTSTAWRAVRNVVGDALSAIFRALGSSVGSISRFGSRMWGGIVSGFRSAINTIISWWNNLEFNIPKIHIKGTDKDFGGGSFGTPNIPYLANGGFVTSPTLAWVGEAGAELVLPLTKQARAMELLRKSGLVSSPQSSDRPKAGSRTKREDRPLQIIEQLNVRTIAADPAEMADEIEWALKTAGR